MQVKIDAQPIESGKEEKKEYGKFEKWEIESAARTLVEAEEIKANPEKMKYVKMCMDKQYGATKRVIESIEDLRAIAKGETESEESSEDMDD